MEGYVVRIEVVPPGNTANTDLWSGLWEVTTPISELRDRAFSEDEDMPGDLLYLAV